MDSVEDPHSRNPTVGRGVGHSVKIFVKLCYKRGRNRPTAREAALETGLEQGEPARWSLRLLGGFELMSLAGGTVTIAGKRERVLLAYLALNPNGRCERRKLVRLL